MLANRILRVPSDSILRYKAFWIAMPILTLIITLMVIVIHDQNVDLEKAHTNWHNAWKESIDQLPCDALKHNIALEDGRWLHSELNGMYVQRAEELKC